MPRYTAAESTLMISHGNSRAIAIAQPLLPLAVGPSRMTACGDVEQERMMARLD
jgi:hypothetical protein